MSGETDDHLAKLKAIGLELVVLRAEVAGHAQALQSARLQGAGELSALSSAISTAIGSDRFLDLPDGGDVTLPEQVTRMRLALEAAETKLEQHEERVCRECEGRTFVANPDAQWSRDSDGVDYCMGPEEIDCPRCNGVGYEAPIRPNPPAPIPTVYDEFEEPF